MYFLQLSLTNMADSGTPEMLSGKAYILVIAYISIAIACSLCFGFAFDLLRKMLKKKKKNLEIREHEMQAPKGNNNDIFFKILGFLL